MTTKIVAILNITPDSFSDGGQFGSATEAIERGIQLRDEGADIVDVGGESTRPGAERVPARDESKRVIPVIKGLVSAGVTVSIDTMNASTAMAAADAGAAYINDVSGGLADPQMYQAVAHTGLDYIAMNWRAAPGFAHAGGAASYGDVVADVRAELKARLAEMIVAGVDVEKVVLDPGLGFAKDADDNWALLNGLESLGTLGRPLLIGASRKRFLAPFAAEGAPAAQRDFATAIVSALAARAGVWGVRVHDVATTKTALAVADAWNGAAHD